MPGPKHCLLPLPLPFRPGAGLACAACAALALLEVWGAAEAAGRQRQQQTRASPVPGMLQEHCITSDEALVIDEYSHGSIVIVGGGYIAVGRTGRTKRRRDWCITALAYSCWQQNANRTPGCECLFRLFHCYECRSQLVYSLLPAFGAGGVCWHLQGAGGGRAPHVPRRLPPARVRAALLCAHSFSLSVVNCNLQRGAAGRQPVAVAQL